MNKIKLIIADDHHLIRLGLKNLLASNADLEILHEFDNGLDALNYILDKEPDMAIVDIDMPGISGLELCKVVRENKRSTKILFLTMLNQGILKTILQKMMTSSGLSMLVREL